MGQKYGGPGWRRECRQERDTGTQIHAQGRTETKGQRRSRHLTGLSWAPVTTSYLAYGETEAWGWLEMKEPKSRTMVGLPRADLYPSSEEASSLGVISKVGRGWQR